MAFRWCIQRKRLWTCEGDPPANVAGCEWHERSRVRAYPVYRFEQAAGLRMRSSGRRGVREGYGERKIWENADQVKERSSITVTS